MLRAATSQVETCWRISATLSSRRSRVTMSNGPACQTAATLLKYVSQLGIPSNDRIVKKRSWHDNRCLFRVETQFCAKRFVVERYLLRL